WAQRQTAMFLERLGRSAEAAAAWAETARLWQEARYGPGRVEALLRQALALPPADQAAVTKLPQEAIQTAEEEAAQPGQTRDSLNDLGGASFFNRGRLEEAELLFGACARIDEKRFPQSLHLAAALHNFGAVLLQRGRLDEAEQ